MTAQPQIALVGERSWAIIGPCFTITGLLSLGLCPKWIVRWLIPACSMKNRSSGFYGLISVIHWVINDLDALIEALLQCGARLIPPLSNDSLPGRSNIRRTTGFQITGGKEMTYYA